jgi:hypothetical protein
MSERFVVVRVGQDDDGVKNDPVPDSGGAEGDSIDPQDSVPILEYSREPNRYGKILPVPDSARYYLVGISYVFNFGLFMVT